LILPGQLSDLTSKPNLKLSWVLLFLNVGFFVLLSFLYPVWPHSSVRNQLNDPNFKGSVVKMYLQTLDAVEKQNRALSEAALFSTALRDQKFWARLDTIAFVGDQVQITETKKILKEFYTSYLASAHYQLGLGTMELSPWSWLTYQFVHASVAHLIGNIFLIFMLVSFLEKKISSEWLAAVYLLSGFAGGAGFLFFDHVGSLSVVGASASACGLMGFTLCTQLTRHMPWFYMVAPVKERGYGQIHLPVFFIFPIFLVSDFVSLLWEPSGVAANIAVSAHVSGALMGILCGLVYLFLRSKAPSHGIFGDHNGLHELS
jgi:membrane associated rhomboid family serine protease